MRVQQFTGVCLLALTTVAQAGGVQYLWGEDRMGKMVKRATSSHTTSTSSVKTSSAVKTSSTAKTSSSVKVSSSVKTSSTSSAKSSSVSSSSAAKSSSASSSASVKSSSSVSSSSTSASASSTLVADSSCKNGALTRSCWGNGYSIATDFDQKHPTTGNTVSYNLEITNTTCNVDGTEDQPCYLINGQYPGPTIEANWGDTLSITVKNSMQYNGTSMHWHGIRQLNSCGSDGVNGVTECPLAPGDTTTYTFICSQFGTSWYHSHHSSQYGMGVIGTILINGPATSNYDVDLGTFTVNDWYYSGAWAENTDSSVQLQQASQPPPADTILINGTNNNASGGKYAQVTVQPGKKHRLRMINPSVDNFIRVSLDNHPFTVISADFIPVNPLPGQNWVLFGPGQRYDVIFTANQTAGTYWFRAEVAGDCLSANNGKGRALFTYSGQTVSAPTDANTAPPTNGCGELTTSPYWKQPVDSSTFESQYEQLTVDLTQEQVTTNGANLVVWALNRTAMNINWGQPTLSYVSNGTTSSLPAEYDVIEIPNEGVWTYWIVQTLQTTEGPDAIAAPPPPHPIHLHGHDFFVLGSGSGSFPGSSSLNFANPPRRDTSTLPSDGWLAVAFMANNPGAWLMHCHIAWHVSEGLGVQFLEAKNQIVMPDMTAYNQQCANWNAFYATSPYQKEDSGL